MVGIGMARTSDEVFAELNAKLQQPEVASWELNRLNQAWVDALAVEGKLGFALGRGAEEIPPGTIVGSATGKIVWPARPAQSGELA